MSPVLPLRVMTFNIWRSGGLSLAKTVDAIRMASPDVAGLQECDGSAAETIATELGLHWANDANGHVILSRHPIVRSLGTTANPWGGLGATIAAAHGTIHVFDAHLHYTCYGPYLMREGRSPAHVLEQEQLVRMPGLLELLHMMEPSLESGEPTFLVGDFNAPSHLDYPEGPRWPASVACADRGLLDSYRVVHPQTRGCPPEFSHDDPGITWTPIVAEEPHGAFDRIDFVYYAASVGVTPTSSVTLDARNCVAPWPSDHRAVLSTFGIERV